MLFRSTRPSHLVAGCIAVLVGYTSSAAIVFQAARAAGAGPAEIASWLFALGLGMGLTCIGLSLRYRVPVLTAWSTPGAALLATSLVGVGMANAVGCFLLASLLTLAAGLSGAFERLLHRLPPALAAAMLAGVLFKFGLGVFGALGHDLVLVGAMLVLFIAARRLLPRYAVPLTLALGLAVAAVQGRLGLAGVNLALARPLWTWPAFDPATLLGVGLPLFVVTMASQNLPGLAVLRANGYTEVPVSPLISWTGVAGLVLAPLGGFAFNLAAITAAICMSPDADHDPARRYLAAVWAGVFYLITGALGATVAALLAAFPQTLVLALAGLALLGTIGNSLDSALREPDSRDAALVTLLVTASGFTLAGIGSAFWGLVLGLLVHAASSRR